MYLQVSNKKKIFKNNLKTELKKGVNPDLLVRGTDWRIRIRTKMSRIPNTGSYANTAFWKICCSFHIYTWLILCELRDFFVNSRVSPFKRT
jgi:hypothetical protein